MMAPRVVGVLKRCYDDKPDTRHNASRLVKALARILGGPWAEEARKVWGIEVPAARPSTLAARTVPAAAASAPRPSTGTSSGPSAGPRQAQAHASRKPDASTDPCAVCGVRPSPGSKHKLCGGCKAVLYCSKECQVKHWKEGGHKSECSKVYI